jgi:urocanate hydratase
LAVDPIESAALGFAFQVERFYAGLISAAHGLPQVSHLRPVISPREANSGSEPGLGGKLLYARELNAEARALLVAANIAGAASLVSTANAAAGKQAVRDGVVDFLVTSLDEALRILKNEIRKRATVAVCVGSASEAVEREMLERGVLPDLARPHAVIAPPKGQALLMWSVASAPAIWLPKLDAMAADCLQSDDGTARRWLRLAPRYLGRLAQGVRLLRCDEGAAANFLERVREEVERGGIGIAVEVMRIRKGQPEHYSFAPPAG